MRWRFWEPKRDRSAVAFAYALQQRLDVKAGEVQVDRAQMLAEQGGEETQYTHKLTGLLIAYDHVNYFKGQLLQEWGLEAAYWHYSRQQDKKWEGRV